MYHAAILYTRRHEKTGEIIRLSEMRGEYKLFCGDRLVAVCDNFADAYRVYNNVEREEV